MKSDKAKYVILTCICIVCVLVFIILTFAYRAVLDDNEKELESLRDAMKQFETTEPPIVDTSDVDIIPPLTEPTDTTTADISNSEQLLDFNAMWDINPDICAWIEIKDTRIDYPVLQSADNDTKYLTTAYDGSPYIGGALFTQASYNSKDFNDPVTVIYGHTMRSGMLFGRLQKYYSTETEFKNNQTIKLYLPGEVRYYTAFAAVPYDSIHILHTYDFSNNYWYNRFFEDVQKIREFGVVIDKEAIPETGDRVIILSVCWNQNAKRRYLVMAVLNDDLADNKTVALN